MQKIDEFFSLDKVNPLIVPELEDLIREFKKCKNATLVGWT